MTDQAGYYPRNEFDAVGIEIGKSTNTKVTNINIDFRARGGQVVGYCAAIDIGAHDVKIRDINCINNYAGVMVSPGTIGSFNIAEEDRPNAISNIYISNLSFSGRWATGILSQLNLFAMRNITWNGVTVLSGTPVVNNLCYQKIRGMTSHWANCSPWVQVNVTDVWFKSYRGNLPPEEDWRKDLYGFSNSTLDLHLEDWMSTDVTEV